MWGQQASAFYVYHPHKLVSILGINYHWDKAMKLIADCPFRIEDRLNKEDPINCLVLL